MATAPSLSARAQLINALASPARPVRPPTHAHLQPLRGFSFLV